VDQILKLQPHRTMHLQGFDDYGAAAALWGASDTGFTVSGVFRDMADFAVLVLLQKDDPFGHLFSYLPDGDLSGIVLDFDVTWQGIQSWESLKNAWTDWNTLDYSVNGVGQRVPWFGTTGITVTCNTTGRTGASATYTLNLNSPQPGDKVTLPGGRNVLLLDRNTRQTRHFRYRGGSASRTQLARPDVDPRGPAGGAGIEILLRLDSRM
jgi:hypothetical protein